MKNLLTFVYVILIVFYIVGTYKILGETRVVFDRFQQVSDKLDYLNENYENIVKDRVITLPLTGQASWYDYQLVDGWSSVGHYVCASRVFEKKDILRVTNLDNGKSTACLVTDYVENLDVIIDLSSTAFEELAPLDRGIINVSVSQIN